MNASIDDIMAVDRVRHLPATRVSNAVAGVLGIQAATANLLDCTKSFDVAPCGFVKRAVLHLAVEIRFDIRHSPLPDSVGPAPALEVFKRRQATVRAAPNTPTHQMLRKWPEFIPNRRAVRALTYRLRGPAFGYCIVVSDTAMGVRPPPIASSSESQPARYGANRRQTCQIQL